jgi:hypothetical protein
MVFSPSLEQHDDPEHFPDWPFQLSSEAVHVHPSLISASLSFLYKFDCLRRTRTKLPLTPPFSILSLLLDAGLDKTSSKTPTLTSLPSPAYNSTFFDIYSFRIHSNSLNPIKQASKTTAKMVKAGKLTSHSIPASSSETLVRATTARAHFVSRNQRPRHHDGILLLWLNGHADHGFMDQR